MPQSKHRRRRAWADPGSHRSITSSARIAVLVIAGCDVGSACFVLNSPGGSNDGYVEGVGEQQDLMLTANHVPEGQSVEYSTTPPTSGDHWEIWAECGFYDYALPDEQVVHNLEHGNIVINYNLTSEEEVQRLRDVIDDISLSNIWGVTRFYDEIPEGTVVLTAWGVLDTMPGIDEEPSEPSLSMLVI